MKTGSKADSVASEIEDLRKRLQLLEDEKRIIETLHRYSHTIDYGPPEAWAGVFTEDGVFDVYRVNGRKAHKESGRKELEKYLATKRLPPLLYDKHLVCSPVVSIKGDTAQVESYVVLLRELEVGGATVASWGRYHDTLVRQANGTWLIKERLAEMEVGVGRAYKAEWGPPPWLSTPTGSG